MNPIRKCFLLTKGLVLSISFLIWGPASNPAQAQAGDDIRREYPEMAALFNAFDVTHAALFDEITALLNDPAAAAGRDTMAEHFRMARGMGNMTHGGAHGAAHGGAHSMGMSMGAPYGESEVAARVRLLGIMRDSHNDRAAARAFTRSDALDRRTAEVLQRGRRFENRLFAVYIDDDIIDKRAAVAEAVADYLRDDDLSVATSPKDSTYLLNHDQATAFQTSFPRLSGFLWSQQWLQLAALEAVILEHLDDNFKDRTGIALERFWNKIGSAGGMSMFPAPVELPMAPAIAPNLYSQSPDAAVILDNLNVLETLVADALSHPHLDDRQERIRQLAAEFTDKSEHLGEQMDYLLFSLRGGIYNQGGPAVGELDQSERNRSRAMMNMRHSMIMSTP